MYEHVRLASPLAADIGCFVLILLLPHVHAQGVSNQFCPSVFQQINCQISRLHNDM